MARRRSNSLSSRKTSRNQGFAQLPFAPLSNPHAPMQIISADQLETIHRASLEILRDIGMRVTPAEVKAAKAAAEPETVAALTLGRDRILDHHRRQLPENDRYVDATGVELGSRWSPVASVGLLVPRNVSS